MTHIYLHVYICTTLRKPNDFFHKDFSIVSQAFYFKNRSSHLNKLDAMRFHDAKNMQVQLYGMWQKNYSLVANLVARPC